MQVKLKANGQITVPASLLKQIAAVSGDFFDVTIVEGKIVLSPHRGEVKQITKLPMRKKSVDISKYIGSGKGLFKSVEEIDELIRFERDQWE